MGLPKASLTFDGPVSQINVHDFASRGFCQNCGGTLLIQYHCYPNKTHVAAGTMTASDWDIPKVGMHIWVRSKPAWYTIPEDGVPRFAEFDPEFLDVQGKFEARQAASTK
jgi:hypothetical protein